MKIEEVDQILKETLNMQEYPSEVLNQTIKNEMEEREMKKHFGRKILVASLAATLLLGGAVYAATTGGYSTMTSNEATIQEDFDEMDEIIADAGYSFKYVEELGGFTFESAEVADCQDYDENGNATTASKSPSICYTNDEGQQLNVTVSVAPSDATGEGMDIYEGTPYLYMTEDVKLIPEDYVMSEEEQEQEANGEVYFSTVPGLEEVVNLTNYSVTFLDEGLFYTITTSSVVYTEEEMVELIGDIVNQ